MPSLRDFVRRHSVPPSAVTKTEPLSPPRTSRPPSVELNTPNASRSPRIKSTPSGDSHVLPPSVVTKTEPSSPPTTPRSRSSDPKKPNTSRSPFSRLIPSGNFHSFPPSVVAKTSPSLPLKTPCIPSALNILNASLSPIFISLRLVHTRPPSSVICTEPSSPIRITCRPSLLNVPDASHSLPFISTSCLTQFIPPSSDIKIDPSLSPNITRFPLISIAPKVARRPCRLRVSSSCCGDVHSFPSNTKTEPSSPANKPPFPSIPSAPTVNHSRSLRVTFSRSVQVLPPSMVSTILPSSSANTPRNPPSSNTAVRIMLVGGKWYPLGCFQFRFSPETMYVPVLEIAKASRLSFSIGVCSVGFVKRSGLYSAISLTSGVSSSATSTGTSRDSNCPIFNQYSPCRTSASALPSTTTRAEISSRRLRRLSSSFAETSGRTKIMKYIPENSNNMIPPNTISARVPSAKERFRNSHMTHQSLYFRRDPPVL